MSRKVQVPQNTKEYKLLTIIQEYAPTGKAQQLVSAIYNNTPEDHRARTLVTILFDGLHFGNWPWTFHKRSS